MGKTFSRKELKLLARRARRRHQLKVNPKTFNVEKTVEMANLSVIRSLESKIKAAQA
ncbi:MAG: hypothetical protein OHK0039_38990 [Bacteroidia bacterium]